MKGSTQNVVDDFSTNQIITPLNETKPQPLLYINLYHDTDLNWQAQSYVCQVTRHIFLSWYAVFDGSMGSGASLWLPVGKPVYQTHLINLLRVRLAASESYLLTINWLIVLACLIQHGCILELPFNAVNNRNTLHCCLTINNTAMI